MSPHVCDLVQVEEELKEQCRDVLSVLDTHLIKSAVSPEAQVFFSKMRGDYYRYIAEVTVAGTSDRDVR